VTRDPVAALTVATGMAGTDDFAAVATWVTRDSIAAITVATCMTCTATGVRMGMLEDGSFYIFQDYNGCFFIFNHNWSSAYCYSGHGH
jgi:hypothetical protein